MSLKGEVASLIEMESEKFSHSVIFSLTCKLVPGIKKMRNNFRNFIYLNSTLTLGGLNPENKSGADDG